jgi:excinuclease ABC subunit A
MKLDRYKTHDIEIVVNRLVIEDTDDNEKRWQKVNNTANQGENVLMVLTKIQMKFVCRNWNYWILRTESRPNLFSFNLKRRLWSLQRMGTVNEINPKKIIPNPKLSKQVVLFLRRI